jgi:hypothetical protein
VSPDIRQHRGAHPADAHQFGEDQLPVLRAATAELSWLLSHQYKMISSLKLVGDRHALTARQRLAVSRTACSDQSRERRAWHCVSAGVIQNEHVIVDGFNLIITVEAALSGAALLICRDNCLRDLSSVHGSYRSVQETEHAICLIGEVLAELKPLSVLWLLDRPVSNSGRLARKISDLALEHGWPWEVEVVFNPDKNIIVSERIAITSDSSVLDRLASWTNFNRHLIEQRLASSLLVDLRS